MWASKKGEEDEVEEFDPFDPGDDEGEQHARDSVHPRVHRIPGGSLPVYPLCLCVLLVGSAEGTV